MPVYPGRTTKLTDIRYGNELISEAYYGSTLVYQRNRPPEVSLISPANGATNLEFSSLNFSWSASDPDNDPLTYTLYLGNSLNTMFQQKTGTMTGSTQVVNLTGLARNTTLYWYVKITDSKGATKTSLPARTFTTKANANPTISMDAPDYNAMIFPTGNAVELKWKVGDADWDQVNCRVYFSTSMWESPDTLIWQGNVSPGVQQTISLNNLVAGQQYFWKVIANDGYGSDVDSSWYKFTIDGIAGLWPLSDTMPFPYTGRATGGSGNEYMKTWAFTYPNGDLGAIVGFAQADNNDGYAYYDGITNKIISSNLCTTRIYSDTTGKNAPMPIPSHSSVATTLLSVSDSNPGATDRYLTYGNHASPYPFYGPFITANAAATNASIITWLENTSYQDSQIDKIEVTDGVHIGDNTHSSGNHTDQYNSDHAGYFFIKGSTGQYNPGRIVIHGKFEGGYRTWFCVTFYSRDPRSGGAIIYSPPAITTLLNAFKARYS